MRSKTVVSVTAEVLKWEVGMVIAGEVMSLLVTGGEVVPLMVVDVGGGVVPLLVVVIGGWEVLLVVMIVGGGMVGYICFKD